MDCLTLEVLWLEAIVGVQFLTDMLGSEFFKKNHYKNSTAENFKFTKSTGFPA